jgi:hypothetical protein
MPSAQPKLRRGRIVWAEVSDASGFRKARPVVILTPTEEIRESETVAVVAITTTFSDPPPDHLVSLPWFPRGHPVPRLKKRSAVVTKWVTRIMPSDVIEVGGDVPRKQLIAIDKKLEELQSP